MKYAIVCLLFGTASSWAQQKLAPSPVEEVGVYYQQNGQWIDMMPERVNWQTGGVIKTVATGFIVKPDVNGRLRYGQSKTALTKPIQLLVRTPEGTEITEYQLIRLRTHSNAREFRTVTGGLLHESGGSNRDDVPFDPQRIATRTWIISLADLEPGEYGLLPPGMNDARSASAHLGKMYTFTTGTPAAAAQTAPPPAKKSWKQSLLEKADPF